MDKGPYDGRMIHRTERSDNSNNKVWDTIQHGNNNNASAQKLSGMKL